ncbi:MAG: NYN domain-containing protein [Lachnospiraceae bacterium]|nr:NYN domain-containing protein [Lachnospiraceae bacterium]
MAEEKRFAILIDADNIAPKYVESIINEVSNKGIITYKRVYCDWTGDTAKTWKKKLLANSFTPIQQYSYTYGKNATDSAMIIDAMDILYGGEVEGFALCSSDSDFTRLAARLREAGKIVIGLGESKAPQPFCAACNEFKFLDKIYDMDDDNEKDRSSKASAAKKEGKTEGKSQGKKKAASEREDDQNSITPIETIAAAIKDIILENGNEANGIDMGELGSRLQKRYPAFDTRNYGYSKFSIFLKKFDFLSMSHIGTSITVTLDMPGKEAVIEDRIVEMVRAHGEKGVNLGSLSSEINNEFPDFTPKEYGFSKFEKFISSIEGLEVRNVSPLNKKVFPK